MSEIIWYLKGERKMVNGEEMVMGVDLTWGGEHTMKYTDDVL